MIERRAARVRKNLETRRQIDGLPQIAGKKDHKARTPLQYAVAQRKDVLGNAGNGLGSVTGNGDLGPLEREEASLEGAFGAANTFDVNAPQFKPVAEAV